MSFITAHFDDSGTHRESTIAVAACYASTVEQWKEFERNWEEIKKAEGFKVFHMADFVGGHGEFTGWSDRKKRRTLDSICCVINLRAEAGYAVSVTKQIYDEVVWLDSPFREIYCGDFHYTFALRQCASRLSIWRDKYHKQSSMKYVFDRMGSDHGKGEIMAVMNGAIKKSESETRQTGCTPMLTGFSFENKSVVIPLQASDVLAWTVLQQMHKLQSKRKPNWAADFAWARLNSHPGDFYASFFVKDQLEGWRDAYIQQLFEQHIAGKIKLPDPEADEEKRKKKHGKKQQRIREVRQPSLETTEGSTQPDQGQTGSGKARKAKAED